MVAYFFGIPGGGLLCKQLLVMSCDIESDAAPTEGHAKSYSYLCNLPNRGRPTVCMHCKDEYDSVGDLSASSNPLSCSSYRLCFYGESLPYDSRGG